MESCLVNYISSWGDENPIIGDISNNEVFDTRCRRLRPSSEHGGWKRSSVRS